MRLCLCIIIAILPFLSQSQIATENFIPFGVENGDSAMASVYWDNSNQTRIMDGFVFPYFKKNFTSIFINSWGSISFSAQAFWSTTRCGTYYYYHDSSRDIPIILPFASLVDASDGGNIYYRQTTDSSLLQRATSEVQIKFPAINSLNWMFVATWDQVPSSFASLHDKYCRDFSSRNTFQAVLATNGNESFGIFYYSNLTWTTARQISINSNTCSNLEQASVGFQSGNPSSTYEMRDSCLPAIRNVATNSNVNQGGKWIFRFDEEHPPCDGHGLTKRFHFSPSSISTLGHVQISVVAPCLEKYAEAKCEFSTPGLVTVDAVILPDKSAAICEAPFSYSNNVAPTFRLNVNTSSGSWSRYTGYMSIHESINIPYAFQLKSDMTVTMTWTQTLLGDIDTPCELHLVEFINSIWTPKGLLKAELLNTGQYSGELDDTTPITKTESFFIVQLKTKTPFPKYLFSSIQYESLGRTEEYFDQRCNSWYENDKGPPLDIIPCPPLYSQIVNNDTFERDRIATGELLDFYHPGAEHAFRQRYRTVHLGGQQCVYKNGTVLLGLRSGGRSELYSPNAIGGLAYHWRDDILPWYWCCKYTSSNESCAKLYEKRPADPLETPTPVNGQILTFDHLSYTFNGIGEYWMVKSNEFLMQAKMEELNDESVFTALVIKETINQYPMHVQIYTSPLNGLQVLLNEEGILPPPDHEEGTPFSIADNGVTISILSSKEVRVDFVSGFEFEFTTKNNIAINVNPSTSTREIPGNARRKTVGLFGVFDGKAENDLTAIDGTVIPSTSSKHVINRDFGSKWKIGKGESLFVKVPKDIDEEGEMGWNPDVSIDRLKKEL